MNGLNEVKTWENDFFSLVGDMGILKKIQFFSNHTIHWIVTYLLDSVTHLLNNPSLNFSRCSNHDVDSLREFW